MKEYIEREAAIKALCFWCAGNVDLDDDEPCSCLGKKEILDTPAADVVSREVFEQVKWERDMALQTLEEHGIGLGEQSDVVKVVRCKDCKYYKTSPLFPTKQGKFCYKVLKDNGIAVGHGFNENDFCSYGKRRNI